VRIQTKIKSSSNILKSFILHFALRQVIRLFNTLLHRNYEKPTKYYGNYLLATGIFSKSNENLFNFDRTWNETYSMFNRGEYQKSISLRNEILSEVYLINGVTDENYFPPNFSKDFSGAIGHQGHLGVHLAAQDLGLIPSGRRYLHIKKEDSTKPFFFSIKDRIGLLSNSFFHNSGEPPSQWHIFERMQMIKTRNGFIDLHQLVEKVYLLNSQKNNGPILELDPIYYDNCRAKLKKFGLNDDDWFVTLHVRDAGNPSEHNSQSIWSYLKAIQYILDMGGKIIRIGDAKMPRLPDIPGLIDLSDKNESNQYFHLYALSKAKFFIGTLSGPKVIPPLFNMPMLVTNMTCLGLETINYSEKTLYVPKKIKQNKAFLSFEQILNSPAGFGSLTVQDIKDKNIIFESNSEDEILKAVIEIIDLVFNDFGARDDSIDKRVGAIRKSQAYASTGLLSTSWLEENSSWFLA